MLYKLFSILYAQVYVISFKHFSSIYQMSDIFTVIERDLSSDDNTKIENAKNKASKLCMSEMYPSHNKFAIFQILVKYQNPLAMEILSRWRDSIMFYDNGIPEIIKLLAQVARSPLVVSHERIYTVVHLYNMSYFQVCYSCFSDITYDMSMDIKHRIEAAKYLFIGGGEDRETALDSISDIISEHMYSTKFRYETIASYISKTGIATSMNMQKIRVPYDEYFVLELQKIFFSDKKNQVQYIILSGQYILQADSADKDIKQTVISDLFGIAENTDNTENIRADAADVILRLGDSVSKKRARNLIIELGYGGDGRKVSVADRIKTVYNDSQNVHNDTIYKCIEKYIEKIMNESGNYKLIKYDDTIHQIKLYTRMVDQEKYKNCKNNISLALDRISVDSAMFTENKVTLSELLCHVWSRILSDEFTDAEKSELKQRLFEELYEMTNTCSSGHAARLVNVMSFVDDNMIISWEDQIKSNILGRVQARMKECKDPDLSSSIALGMMEDADEEDKNIYTKWLNEQFDHIEKELRDEFVIEGYLKNEDFEIFFTNAIKEW